MKKTIKTPAGIPAVTGLMLKTFIGKGERAKSFSRRTGVLAVWLGLMFIGINAALLGVQSAHASTTLYDVQFNLSSLYQQTGAAIIGQAGDFWNRLAAASGTSALANTAGNMNGVSFTWAGTGLLESGNANPSFGNGDSNLMDSYIYCSSSGSQNMTFSNLTANASFTLYIYTQGDSAATGRKLSVTFNGSTYTSSAAVAGTTSFVSGQNYLTISGTTTAGGTLPFSYTYAVGEADLNGIQLSVADVAPSITTQPASQVVAAGVTVNLSVTVSGTAPLAYQWLKDGRIVPGATNSTLHMTGAVVTNSGVYYAVVTNMTGLCISPPAMVAVASPQLLAWGNNSNGQLGDGTTTDAHLPESVASNVVVAAAGGSHSLFLKSDSTLWAMGNNQYGQLGDTTLTDKHFPESVASNVVAMAAGQWHSLFLKSDGTLWGMGNNVDGQLGDGTTTGRSVPESVASNVVAVAAGANFSVFLKSDGTLWTMGYNYDGELGDGTTTYRHSPVAVLGGSNVIAVAAGAGHSLFLKSDGTLWGMGYNENGELGDGTLINRSSPMAIPGGSNAVMAAGGANHTVFLKNDGTLWAMGYNGDGQLGDGTTTGQTGPESVASNVVAVTAGWFNSLFIKGDGTLWAMGQNTYGQLGDGTTTQRNSPVSVPGLSLATVVSGCYAYHTMAVGLTLPPVIASQPASQTVAAGSNVTFTVTASGFEPLSCQWQLNGANLSGATATNYNLTSVTPADAGNYRVVVSNAAGSVTSSVAVLTVLSLPAITAPPASQVAAVGETVNLSVTATVAGPFYYQWFRNGGMVLGATNSTLSMANAGVTNSGIYYVAVTNAYGLNISQPATVTVGNPQLLAWGYNGYGQLGDGTVTDVHSPESVAGNVVTAAAGETHSLCLKSDGTLWAMGYNCYGQLGDGTTTNRSLPESVASNVVAVAAGEAYSLFLRSDGTLWGMGYNADGELGDGTTNNRYLPESVASNVVAMAAGEWHSLYLKSDGTLWAMGANQFGQLGDGTTNGRSNAVSVVSNVVAVAAGGGHSLFLKRDGTLWAMGNNGAGELGDGTGVDQSSPVSVASNVVAMAAGFEHSAYLKIDGTLWVMGQNAYGQLGDGTMTNRSLPESLASNAVAVTAGASHSLYLESDGTLRAMGLNSNGQLGDETTTQRNSPVIIAGMTLANVISGCSAYHTLAVGVPLPPVITSQPTNQTVVAGSPVTFTVIASGVAPLACQWQFNGTNLSGATETNHNIADVTMANAGNYTVVVSNAGGSVTSSVATLTVLPVTVTVTVSANPTDAGSVGGGGVYLIGSNAVLTATSSNNWQFINWNDGTTNNPYVITVPATNITYTAQFEATATITVSANPNSGGSVIGGGIFLAGSTNLISAVASNGWVFVGWSDGTINNSYSIMVTSNLTLTANFVPAATVTTVALPPEGGLTAGDGTYAIGNDATVTATATNGWAFLSWNGAVTNNPWTFLVPSNATVCTANFAQVSTVTGLANPTNAGSVAGGGVYIVGSNAVLTATASNNWQFINWNDGTTNNPYVITVPATNITFTAQFAATATITVSANPNSGGSVTGGGTFLVGSTNLISAVASNGWAFVRWDDGATDHSHAIVVASNRTYTADFAPVATVTVIINPTNAGAWVTGGGAYPVGSNAVLTAVVPTLTNGNSWRFLNWNGTVTNYTRTGNTNNPLEFTVHSNITATANFAQITSDGFVYTYIWVKPKSPIIKGITVRPMNDTMVPGIEIIGYDGDATSLVIPSHIDDVSVNEIGPEALTGKHFDSVEFDDGISDMTLDPTCVDATDFDVANMADFEGLLLDGEFVIEAGAFAECDEVLIPAGLSAAALAILAAAVSDLAIVSATCDPVSGGHTSGSGLYIIGTPVHLTASANSGWRFNGWSDGIQTNRYWVTAPYTVTATFVPVSTVTVLANPEDGGTVTGSGTYDVGTSVMITATAEEGWKFSDWSDGSTEETNTITVPDHDVTYTANFEVEVEAEAEPPWGGVVTGGGDYPVDSPVTLVAIANTGWRFNGWFLDGFLTNSPTLVTVALPQEGLKYKAKFVQIIQVIGLANPTNAGSVAGSGVYDIDDTNKTLTATASNNWVFINWNDGATNNPYTIPPITITNMVSITYTANFAAVTSVAVSSSINPCGYRDGVTFTASVTPTNATGTVQFLTNGVAFDLETLTNGAATSLMPPSLPRGTNLITAVYSGDSLDLPGTNTLEQVVTNHPPQAAPATYTLTTVPGYKILITDLATNWSDADGDLITLASVNASTNGGAVSIGGKYIYYSDTNLVTDQFTYLISDGQGGTGIGTVNLLSSNGTVNTNRTLNITGLTPNGDGSVTIHFAGIPGYTYWVQAATNVAQPQWETISTNIAGTNGLWNYTDTNAANYSLRFYRTCKP